LDTALNKRKQLATQLMGQSASVAPFTQREGIRGEDKYAATTFRRVELQESDLNILYAIFLKIKEKNPYPKIVNSQSICSYFGVNKSDFVLKLFDAVDFDGNESIDFKEFTLGLWNFLSLTSDFLAALVFYIYDPLKFNLLDMKELKELLEAVHGVKMSSFTPSLNSIMKTALLNNKNSGITPETFCVLCKDNPFILKPIVSLQKQLRKKIIGAAFWKKLEFRRSASIRGNLRDVNYVYIVNEETEIWRKKDFELGIAREYELNESEIALKQSAEKLQQDKEALLAVREREREMREEREKEDLRLLDEAEEARQVQELKDKIAENKDLQQDDNDFVAKNRMKMSEVEGRDVAIKKGVMKDFADFAETVFCVAEGKFVPPEIQIEAATVFEFPGEEKFVFGIVTDNKKKEEKIVMVNRDLTRRRLKGSDLARINSNFKFVGYSKLSMKTLPDQIKVRANIPLLALCNNISQMPKPVHESAYSPGKWNENMRALVTKSVNQEESTTYLEEIDKIRKSKSNQEEEVIVETQEDRVNSRVSNMLAKQKENQKVGNGSNQANSRRSMINSGGRGSKRNTINSGGRGNGNNLKGAAAGGRQSRSTINAGSTSSSSLGALKPVGGKLAPLRQM
jgi:hypothetical protein